MTTYSQKLAPTCFTTSPSCLAENLREIAVMLEVRSPFIRSAERHYTTGSRDEPLKVISGISR
ncbi:hypothetical protein PRCB_17600 [Pantoea rodasii]|uniref:Uncharacterized protein n=1 Tax=Pantoea rodasii TaxID=1076549 RepID=A0A2M9W994_9GAMM|nr:hypothetical protein PRCB_17600 [Pantoea rodasii]